MSRGGRQMGKLEGKVAFITGVARGQGRAHAVRLAAEGADIIGIDVCAQLEKGYPGSTEADLAETVRQVSETGRRIRADKADVRDMDELRRAVDGGVSEF